MINPVTNWFKISEYDNKKASTIADLVEQMWLARYPPPSIITYDKGKEFLGHAFKNSLIHDTYGNKAKVATTANPQANAIIEQMHQTLANLVHTFEVEEKYLDVDKRWNGILAAAAFAVRITYHTTLQAALGQLVFGRDMVFNTPFIAD